MPNIAANLARVGERIAGACRRSGRDPAEVTLVAVTKLVAPAEVAELYRLGVRDFGENRVAAGLAKKTALDLPGARWHLIGHLQRNKAAEAVAGGFVSLHSVESLKLLEILGREVVRRDRRLGVFLEVNVSGEASKYGMAPDEVGEFADLAAKTPGLDLLGLMTMAPLGDDPEQARPFFRGLAKIKKTVEAETGLALPHLSMGMSGDFEVAVEEGATLVRVGTALFL
ncbi:MAG: YggS family pyridoxal phosphate-dependent enzyme [Planctomycetota bacterium]|jgi:pyridoxal phosphate enzyme (YggS family)|nr:YggS family pyridoxal phosphate-dependent enzyme [Planctomycetota bacterium]